MADVRGYVRTSKSGKRVRVRPYVRKPSLSRNQRLAKAAFTARIQRRMKG
jgi:hypothetical protein